MDGPAGLAEDARAAACLHAVHHGIALDAVLGADLAAVVADEAVGAPTKEGEAVGQAPPADLGLLHGLSVVAREAAAHLQAVPRAVVEAPTGAYVRGRSHVCRDIVLPHDHRHRDRLGLTLSLPLLLGFALNLSLFLESRFAHALKSQDHHSVLAVDERAVSCASTGSSRRPGAPTCSVTRAAEGSQSGF